MKRSSESINITDGSAIKKIKKLMFKDEKEYEIDQPAQNLGRTVTFEKSEESDGDCDSESEEETNRILSNDDNNETINEDELAILAKYNNFTTAESVVAGLEEAGKEVAMNAEFEEEDDIIDLDSVPMWAEHANELRTLLACFKPTKMFPKTVKVIPQLDNWECIIEQLDFPSWSAAAVQVMGKQFRAKGGETSISFYTNFLLPYVKENIARNGRLDDVLFKTLVEALYRRKEFMKGILYPWCDEEFSGKDGEVLSNVFKNATVKSDTAWPAMLALSRMEYSKPRLAVLRSLLEKKYKLPLQLTSAIVQLFHKMTVGDVSQHMTDHGILPVSWFQTLNLFVSQTYMDLSNDDLKKLFHVCRVHKHPKVTPAIQAYLKMRSNNGPNMAAE